MRLLITVAAWGARAVYAVIKAVVPARHKVVFLSRQSDRPSRDFELLADALRAHDPGLEIVMRCRMLGPSAGERISFALATLGQMYHLASSRACIVDGYVVPVSVLDHRQGLYVVQMWHALGAIKKFGYQTIDRAAGHSTALASAMRMHHNYDLVLCGGPAAIPVFAEAFGVDPAIVQQLGLPRMDDLTAAAAARAAGVSTAGTDALLDRFPLLSEPGRLVVLYAPTVRKGGESRCREVAESFRGERYTLVVKPHPLEPVLAEGDNVVNARGVDLADLLPLCSVLITDYSAIAFEAAAIDVPAFFYVYDIDSYARDTGLNIDPLAEMPEVSSRDIVALSDLIKSGVTHPEVTRRLREGYASAPAGCAGRIADRIIEAMGADEPA